MITCCSRSWTSCGMSTAECQPRHVNRGMSTAACHPLGPLGLLGPSMRERIFAGGAAGFNQSTSQSCCASTIQVSAGMSAKSRALAHGVGTWDWRMALTHAG